MAENAPARFARVAALGLVVLLVCTVLAWIGRDSGMTQRHPVLAVVLYSTFLGADLLTILAGILAATIRRSAAMALVPAAAVLMTFVMLILGFDAWKVIAR